MWNYFFDIYVNVIENINVKYLEIVFWRKRLLLFLVYNVKSFVYYLVFVYLDVDGYLFLRWLEILEFI